MNKIEIYNLINQELKKVILWVQNPNMKEDFDLDALYEDIFSKCGINMKYGVLHPIFSLIDVICDSVRHGERKINKNYMLVDGINDLKIIIDYIDNHKIDELERNEDLKNRLNKLYL